MPATPESKRKYQLVWEKIIAKLREGKGVTIRVAKATEIKKIRKAVWKEKDLDKSREQELCSCNSCRGKIGAPIKEKYRLNCEIEDTLMTFKLVLNQSSIHNL